MPAAASSLPAHRLPVWRLVTTFVVLVGLIAAGGATAPAAFADDYPTWNDVQAARQSESAKQTEVATIIALIAQLQAQVQAAQAAATAATAQNAAAQEALLAGQAHADLLTNRAAALQAQADKSHKQAAQLTAQQYRDGGQNLTGTLLTSSSANVLDLLSRLSSMGKLSSTINGVYVKAVQDTNTAKAVSDQAGVARDALAGLAAAAQAAQDAAVQAQKDMVAALDAQTTHENELQAQLASLTAATATTEQQYQAGVAARAAAAAAAAAAALAAAQAAAASAAASGAQYSAGPVSSDAQTLAQQLMVFVDGGQLSGSTPDHIKEIRWIAQGQSVPNCGIDVKVLQAILIAVQTFGSAGVSDINRRCTGQIEGAGIYSAHYRNGGGHAVDFYSLGGRAATGADSNSLTLIGVLDPIMPNRSGLGQNNCRRAAGDEPRLRNFQDFYDTCDHLHINDPIT
ncbi:hypothetical protein [Subtercola vilae]|uniref:Uncharacterized protein n=1 Tax=Subtercola vilae TaxID=2056433 RepID=A0A4T2C7H8_9MICO|nr:hypothetical protein [Subtercola vilae]TIH40167.1 hypothetical protein D4765_03335 [Subtercola vilae]